MTKMCRNCFYMKKIKGDFKHFYCEWCGSEIAMELIDQDASFCEGWRKKVEE